jgi:hypothetical protein
MKNHNERRSTANRRASKPPAALCDNHAFFCSLYFPRFFLHRRWFSGGHLNGRWTDEQSPGTDSLQRARVSVLIQDGLASCLLLVTACAYVVCFTPSELVSVPRLCSAQAQTVQTTPWCTAVYTPPQLASSCHCPKANASVCDVCFTVAIMIVYEQMAYVNAARCPLNLQFHFL